MDQIEVIADAPNSQSKKRPREEFLEDDEETPLQKICRLSPDRRLLISSVQQLIKDYPDAYKRTLELANSELSCLSETDLFDLKELMESAAGLVGPTDNAQSGLKFVGLMTDQFLNTHSAADRLSNDYDIVNMFNGMLLSYLKKLTRYTKFINKVVELFFHKDDSSQRTSPPVLNPLQAQETPKIDNPIPTIEPTPPPKAVTNQSTPEKPDKIVVDPPSNPPPDHRTERRRKNNSHGSSNK